MDVIKEYLYSTYHLWLKEFDENKFLVGITNYIIEDMEDVNTLSLCEIGAVLMKGDFFGYIENSEEVFELSMPLDSEVIDVNPEAEKELSRLKDNPLNIWLIKIKASNEDQIFDLLNEEEYRTFTF